MQALGIILSIFAGLGCFFVFRNISIMIGEIIRHKRASKDFIKVKTADPEQLKACNHNWSKEVMTVWASEAGIVQTRVCLTCGALAGHDLQLNAPGIEAVKERLEKMEELERAKQEHIRSFKIKLLNNKERWLIDRGLLGDVKNKPLVSNIDEYHDAVVEKVLELL